MKLNSALLGMLAETFVHVGTGQVVGAVDLPVARESATGYPFVPGSGVKGAMREQAETSQHGSINVDAVFGQADQAGALLVSDARLLLLPVRSLQGSYAWVTCPYLLERFYRDLLRAGQSPNEELAKVTVDEGKYLGELGDKLFLEERSFVKVSAVSPEVLQSIQAIIYHEPVANRVQNQLVVLHNNDFAWFALYGLAVQAHNVLNEHKQSTNLFYEEALPPDTLLYCVLSERGDALNAVKESFGQYPYLRLGGNETTGQGWLVTKLLPAEKAQGEGQ